MAEKLIFDSGLVKLDVNGNGLLCFAPSDFNLYQRFLAFAQELPSLEAKYRRCVEETGISSQPVAGSESQVAAAGKALDLARTMDADIKQRLATVFGPGNDFDVLLGGVNVMSWAGNGERVITNFLNAITPYLEKGVKSYMADAASGAVAKAKTQRAKRPKGK